MTDVNKTIDKIVSDFEQVQKEFQIKARACLQEAFKEFFNANPRVQLIYWTQYTPWFNDGDECNFSVHEMYGAVGDGWSEEDLEEYIEDRDNTICSYDAPDGYEAEQEAFKSFTKMVNRLPDEVFELTFGNHAEVTATRKGFTVEEYEHD
jgi:hypothetical protein